MSSLPPTLTDLAPRGDHRTLAEKAFATLHEAIVTGVIGPGTRLPMEELADVLGMSAMPIREALRRLDAVGLVDNVPHRGARVTELSVDDLREIYEVRLALEPLAARRAAERFGDADAQAAAAALAAHVRAYRRGLEQESLAAHTRFHFVLYRAADSGWLLRVITPLWESAERYRLALPARHRRALEQRRAEHERILAACAANDADRAAAELHDHLALSANLVATRMGGEPLFDLLLGDVSTPVSDAVTLRAGSSRS